LNHRRRCRTALRKSIRHPESGLVRDDRAVKGSPLASGLPDRLGRIEFTYVTDWSFTSDCSPPLLTQTQLPLSVTGR
jgi:hypothetical protein